MEATAVPSRAIQREDSLCDNDAKFRGVLDHLLEVEDMTGLRNLEAAVRETPIQEPCRKRTRVPKELLALAALSIVVFTLGCCFKLFDPLFELIWKFRSGVTAQIFGTIIVLGPVFALLAYRVWNETKSRAGESLHIAQALQILNLDLENRVQQRTADLLKAQAALRNEVIERTHSRKASRESESEDQFRVAVETAPDAIYIQVDGCFAYVNSAAVKLFGAARPEDLIGQPLLDRVHPEYRAFLRERIQDPNELRQPVNLVERVCVKLDGSTVEVEVSTVPFTFGKKAGALAFARDITERRRSEERISEQAALLDKAHDAICVQDLSQQILDRSQGAQRLYGWTVEEAVGKNAEHLLFNGDSAIQIEALCNLIRDGEWRGEMHQIDKNGRKLIVESRWSLMRDKSWKPKSILIINTDVTERKHTEARFLRTQRMENLGALAGGIAHDLNNVLAPVMMAAEALASETTSAEDRQMLNIIQSSAQRGSEMVKQILSFARGVAGEHHPLLLKHLVSEIEDFAKRTFPPSIHLRKTVARDLRLVKGDATQLHQVLLNLCVNARDAMPQGGTLTLGAANIEIDKRYPQRQITGAHVLLSVGDTGHGIPAELLERIFEPFFTTKDIGKGTGLGLSTVVGIVKTHGGFLDVSSQPGKGTTFRIYLPATSGATQPVEQPAPVVPVGLGELILAVDDNAAVLEMLKASLEAHNYRVLAAADGAEALRLYQTDQSTIRAVVTDMLMPGMNGAELIHALRKINPLLKVIGTTGQGSADDLVKSAQSQVQCFLTKPFSTQSLLVKLREALD